MEWKQAWTRWGYTPDGVRRGVDPGKRHLLHQCGETPGINQAVFAYWAATGVQRVRVICTDGAIFTAHVTNLARHPHRRSIAYHEPQWGWPRAAWDVIPPLDDALLSQMGLFT
jgi:hypothetical protein